MIIETDIYPADDPWLSLGYTNYRVGSNISFSGLRTKKNTLAQIDKFHYMATSLESSKVTKRRLR